MTGADIDIELKPKGINIIVNTMADRSERQPNALQNAAAELFNEINEIREGIAQSRRKFQQWSKAIQKRLNI
jgi:diacylglycerol kinase (ATP)